MIRTIDIRLNAAHPELPLPEATTYQGAPSTAFLRGVPKSCGQWQITAVNVAVTFPDNLTTTRAAVLVTITFHNHPYVNTNDLEKAFMFAVERWSAGAALPAWRTGAAGEALPAVVIVGAGGGREDHLIGNVFRLAEFAKRVPDVAMITNTGRFDVVDGERTFGCFPGQAVSVFAPEPGTELSSSGLEWPLGGVDLQRLWSGTLNRATGGEFTVRSTSPAIVYRAGPCR